MTTLIMSLMLASGPAPQPDGAQLLNSLRHLKVTGSALFVAAHPDDENTRLLASLANEAGYRTAYLSLTRGEGGQNLIGPELGPPLGVIRTQELLAARRVDGAEQFFTRASDFGYSKSVDETLATWDHDRVLADAVFVIRSLRPDVIIARFPLEAGGTHGHHTASARIAVEAFHSAADAAFHPEWPAWKAKRVVWNTWPPERMKDRALPAGTVTLDTGRYSALLGTSWGELAARSRSMHKSQGFGAAPLHEGMVEHFAPLAGDAASKSLFDGVDATWRRVPGGDKVSTAVDSALREFKVTDPAASVPALLEVHAALRALPASALKTYKLRAVEELIAACAGLFLEASAAHWSVTPGGEVKLNVTALNRSNVSLKLEKVTVLNASVTPKVTLLRGQAQRFDLTVPVSADTRLSSPHWLEAAEQTSTEPQLPDVFTVEYQMVIATSSGPSISLRRPAYFKWTDPIAGERYRPIEVLPAVTVTPDATLLAFTDQQPRTVRLRVSANAGAQKGELSIEAPAGYQVTPASLAFELTQPGDVRDLEFKVRAVAKNAPTNGALNVLVQGARAFTLSRIEYGHIPFQTVLTPAQIKLMRVELKRGKTKRVGYIAGAGDDVAQALTGVGYEVVPLSLDALRTEKLERYDAIVTGIRAFNINAQLMSVHARLMQYVAGGGTVLVQYNTRNWISQVPAQLGPYPFELSQERVTDQTASVTFTPHAVLRAPNVITAADFDGWVQERGLYFAGKWDERYATPLAMNDPGEAPLQGSLLIATHGKGRFVYTGLAFFRQLPAGVPGAYRLFANLIERNK